jgi:hypothetical protein
MKSTSNVERERSILPTTLLLLGVLAGGGVAMAVACTDNSSGANPPPTNVGSPGIEPAASASSAQPCTSSASDAAAASPMAMDPNIAASTASLTEGQRTFRFDTFGDEAFWGDTLKLHRAIEGAAHGGVGAGVSPKTALTVGLKVDATAVPADVAAGIKSGKVNLDDPATTLALLKLNAVVGLTGTMNPDGSLQSIGIQCALCHSTVDDSFAPGIGKRLDGWPNRDLDVGAVINLSPDLTPVATVLGVDEATVRAVLKSWGPGKFDAELFVDGKGMRPDGKTAATLIPAAYGLAGVNLHTYTGWGSIPYWNAFVAVLEMHGKGNFTDTRLDDATQFPVAARNHFGHVAVDADEDRVAPKLSGLHAYQLALTAPKPPAGSFDPAAAKRGDDLFSGAAKCARCHNEPIGTESGWNMHTGAEIGIDEFQASRAPDKRYRTTPLRGIWARQKGGFFHDGRFATLLEVVSHYDTFFQLGLTDAQKTDLVEYLKSL